MKRILLAICVWASSTQAHAFQGFDMFEMLYQSVECVRKPGTDMMICSNKGGTPDTDVTEPVTEPEVPAQTEPRPVGWDLYNRDEIILDDKIDMPGCDNPTANYTEISMDVDQDGDLDLIYGFQCFEMSEHNLPDIKQRGYISHDPYWGWVGNSYLAVFINNSGVFQNDQSMFHGEYPVYDRTFKSQGARNPQDVNSDGYPDVVIYSHWDNSYWNVLTNWHQSELMPGWDVSGTTVLLSDRDGNYNVHILPALRNGSVGSFVTSETGDVYLWNITTEMRVDRSETPAYNQSTWPEEIGPAVYRVLGSDIAEVTTDYLELEIVSDTWPDHHVDYCWTHKNQKPYVTNGRSPACMIENNQISATKDQESFQGKIYINTHKNYQINNLPWDHDRWRHCTTDMRYSEYENGSEVHNQCKIDALTSDVFEFTSLEVYSMSEDQGLYVSASETSQGIVKAYQIDLEAELTSDNIHWLFFLDLGEQYMITGWAWGSTVGSEAGEVIVLNNYGGAVLDPGATPDDFDDYARYVLDNHHSRNRPWNYEGSALVSSDSNSDSWLGGVGWWATHGGLVYQLISEGYCPDVLHVVDTSDCQDETWLTTSWIDREIFQTEPGRSIGFRVMGDIITTEPNLTNLDMAYNPFETQLLDIDSDGDLDLYINDGNSACSQMCLWENTGNFEMSWVNTGVWAQADEVFWDDFQTRCQGPQDIRAGYFENTLCDLPSDYTPELEFIKSDLTISDMDGDGRLDIFSIERDSGRLKILWGD